MAILQDLPADSPQLPALIHHVIFPAWLHGVPLCFFSVAEREEYPGRKLPFDSLHTSTDLVLSFLHREQMIRILEMCDSQPAFPSEPSPPPSSLPMQAGAPGGDLDPSQAKAARHLRGPMLVLAPAGSGKTRTLISRVCNLVGSGVDPACILPIAFNRKAAAEMNERLAGKSLGRVHARTFHSLGYEIVRAGSRLIFDAGRESDLTRLLLKEAFQTVRAGSAVTEGEEFERSLDLLGAAKRDLLPLETVSVNLDGEPVPFSPVFCRFLEIQEERGIMNYDDMIYFAVRILLANDALRRQYQDSYTHILVDEFQDLNRAQILLMEILALPENNLFAVGDDDQLIYGWRGADVRSIIDFPRIHACARETVLSTNYRSSARIVAHAGWLISRNRERVQKPVVPRAGASPGEFNVILGAGLWEQAQSAAEWIARNRGAARWRDTAVLSRYNAHRFIVALALDKRCIPHTAVDGSALFESRVGRDVAAWFNVILSPGSAGRCDLERILRRPVRLLRQTLIESLKCWHDLEQLPGAGILTTNEESALQGLLGSVLSLRSQVPRLSAGSLLGEIDRVMGLRLSYDRRRTTASNPEEADDGTHLDVIEAVSRTFPTPESFLAHIMESLLTRPDPPPESDSQPGRDEVVLSTIHRAKGNEFSRVVFFDLSRRHRPGAGETEEERRVAYVGLTRAKDALLVTANGRRQSPFLREAALDPQFAGRMKEDMQSELSELLKQVRRPGAATGASASRRSIRLAQAVASLQEELRCRSMLSLPPASP